MIFRMLLIDKNGCRIRAMEKSGAGVYNYPEYIVYNDSVYIPNGTFLPDVDLRINLKVYVLSFGIKVND